MRNDFSAILRRATGEMGIPLGPDETAKLDIYRRELLFWNGKMNLVSLKAPEDLPVKHIADSLSALPFIPEAAVGLLDLGAGAGFPGIPLKIVRPRLHLLLLESSRRKVSFLKTVIRVLALENAEAINARAEELSADFRERFDVVISRAALKLPEYISIAAPLVRPGGILIAMKGKNPRAEVEEAVRLENRTGTRLDTVRGWRLPILGNERNIIVLSKR
ncbi:MAG: 16S rRNA (guanine(527)-N(7))-methyltransferase RsmG [Syntrophales bacterium]|nr:16S rRNA (guanine(527)-N(7))-methyltransferase RsmG [Syntrophales bacterium]MDD5233506.1 16S rRNA (guanine(527)-N(7))-methyltransferase RsmG [Syntrophales bacterium]MDD5532420.1 16S rRNA (guanine(527)-N(7))-methyltransferase RsmG [Syntrophales bacterium]